MENLNYEKNRGDEIACAELIDRIYEESIQEHEELLKVPEETLRETTKRALEEMDRLEMAAGSEKALANLTPEVAKNLKALWVFSGPGSYDQPVKNDRYKNFYWARGMDRARLVYAGWLARKISEIISSEPGEDFLDTKDKISKYGPTIIYNGTDEENALIKDVLNREGIIIPPEKVAILGENIRNTADQVKEFRIPEYLMENGKELGLISHTPHLVRILHMIEYHKPLPREMKIRAFPIKSPESGREEFYRLETKGLLYYIYMAKEASENPADYIIHGQKE